MANMYRHDAKKSHADKLARMCGGGYASKKAHGGSAKPKIAHRKRGGKVMHADGEKAKHRLDKKRRADGGSIPLPRPRPQGREVRPSDVYTPEQMRRIEAQKAKGGKVTKGNYVGGHDSKADLIADKQLIKRAIAMHDKQEHHGAHTDLSKLKKGGKVHRRAAGGRLPGGVIGKMKKNKGKSHTNVNVIVGASKPGMEEKPAMPQMPAPMPRVPVPMPGMGVAPGAAPGMPPAGGPPGMPQLPMRKSGGRVDNLTKVKAEGMKAGTQVTHTHGKNDLAEIRRGPPVTYKKGGAVYPKMRYGAGSGEGRLEKIEKYGK